MKKNNEDNSKKAPRPTVAVWKQRTADTHELHMKYFETVGKKSQIMLLGDSMLERWKTTGSELWAKHFKQLKIGNAGVGGDGTQHVLYRIQNGLFNSVKPKLVIILIGTNNIEKDSEKDVCQGVTMIIDQTRERVPDCKVVVYGVLPRKGPSTLKQKINNLNSLMSKIPDIDYRYFGDQFTNERGEWDQQYFDDNVHLNKSGYEKFAQVLLQTIADYPLA